MIPQRVQLAGFLSYKEAQEIAFAGSPIWMLTGANGSGKSAIFDAVTYALYGQHRGGSQNADELINKESTALAVEFDFVLDNQLFRIKRTLKRNKKGTTAGTQQVFTLLSDDWEAVPDTNKKVDFDKWIAAKIGLSYEIFTSSVLLLQGKAEKLLDAKPTGRAEVLAGIVDLERYQRLHEAANAEKLDWKSKRDTFTAQLGGVPEVADTDFAGAMIRIEECERARELAQEAVRLGQERVEASKRWAEAEQRGAAAKDRLRKSESLLGEAATIQLTHQRLIELKQVLPAVEIVVTTRAKSVEATKKIAKFSEEKEETLLRKGKAEQTLERQKRQRTLDKKKLDDAEAAFAKLNAQIRTLTGHLQTVRQVEAEESKLKQYADELGQLPKEPDAELQAARAEVERLNMLDRVLPILERVQTERHELAQAKIAETETKKLLEELKTSGKLASAEAAKAKAEVESARTQRGQAEGVLAVANAEVERAAAAVAEFQKFKGSKKCSACGQPLTMAHFSEELRLRTDAATTAAATQKQAVADAKQIVKAEALAATADAKQTEKLTKLREEYKAQEAAAAQAHRDIDRLTKSLDLRYAEMPDPYQRRIAAKAPTDWATTTFPERDELIGLRREVAGGLDAARRKGTAAEESLKKISDLRTRLDAATQSRDRLKANLPDADAVAMRRDYASAQSQETVLTSQIKGGKAALETLDREIDKTGADAADEAQHLTELTGKLNAEKLTLQHSADTIDKWLKQLPAPWQDRTKDAGLQHYSEWKSELDELVEKKTEQRFQQLEQSRLGLESQRAEVERLAAESEAFPPEVRLPAAELQAVVAAAHRKFADCDAALQAAHKEKLKLDGYRESRAALNDQFKDADGRFHRYKILAELLGRDRLQRHLVRQAERQIVDYGNAVLDRLSGGQLYLQLAGADEGADKALDLDCFNRATGGDPINVLFLSGSQKFRVAVSLALAIGQYASRQHRPIESVIIDEGFGSLDRIGRQTMIQELQNLRGQLKCILLVSHQEEFAEAFAEGYLFELKDGATRVSRFQR